MINPSPENYHVDPGSAEHVNYAIIRPYGETMDANQIQRDLAGYVKSLELGGKYDFLLVETLPLSNVEADALTLFDELGDAPDALLELTKFCAHVAASLGFNSTATLSVGIQGDKYDRYNNINEVPHRDGVQGEPSKETASIRFVYPIGRPGSIILTNVHEAGVAGEQVSSDGTALYIERAARDLDSPHLPPRFLPNGDEKIITTVDELEPDSGALQVIPGNLLVFDITNSPWHAAPKPTVDGAVFTVDIRQSTPLKAVA